MSDETLISSCRLLNSIDFSDLERGLISNNGLQKTKALIHVQSPSQKASAITSMSLNHSLSPISAATRWSNVFSHAIKCFTQGKPLTELKQFNKIKG